MKRSIIAVVLLGTFGGALADSIFDDKPGNIVSPSSPSSPRYTPRPAPAVPQPRETPEPAPAPPTHPASGSPSPEPADPNLSNAKRPSGARALDPDSPESLQALGSQARSAIAQATDLIREYMRRAEAATTAQLESNSAYLSARYSVELARKRLDDMRQVGSADQRLSASAAYTTALSREKKMRDMALASNPEYQDARQLVALLPDSTGKSAAATPGSSAVAAAQAEKPIDKAKEIASAIAQHTLIEGMTYQEACRAARGQAVLFTATEASKEYHWNIRGSIGSHSESSRDVLGRIHYETVTDYGTVGYVKATFIDGKLTSFAKVMNYGAE